MLSPQAAASAFVGGCSGAAPQPVDSYPAHLTVPARPDDAEPAWIPEDPRDLGNRSVRVHQCQAEDTSTASWLAAGNGISSARPSIARAPGVRAISTARMRSSGSTAVTFATLPASARVSSPVPLRDPRRFRSAAAAAT